MRVNVTIIKNWSTGSNIQELRLDNTEMAYFWTLLAISPAGTRIEAWRKAKIGFEYIRTAVVIGDKKSRLKHARRAGRFKPFARRLIKMGFYV